jgi:S1-C subfamily serine protease
VVARVRLVLPDGTVLGEALAIAEGDGSIARATATVVVPAYRLGITVSPAPGGVCVGFVERAGPGARLISPANPQVRARLEAGDVITHINGKPVASLTEVRRALALAGLNGGKVRLRVKDINTKARFVWDTQAQPDPQP